jgi:hypothetical protein
LHASCVAAHTPAISNQILHAVFLTADGGQQAGFLEGVQRVGVKTMNADKRWRLIMENRGTLPLDLLELILTKVSFDHE